MQTPFNDLDENMNFNEEEFIDIFNKWMKCNKGIEELQNNNIYHD